jgi:hypothetical protein
MDQPPSIHPHTTLELPSHCSHEGAAVRLASVFTIYPLRGLKVTVELSDAPTE